MNSLDQQHEVVEFLMQPATHGGAAVERIDTHSAIVFLAGSRALKLKRAVRFDYLDFSTPARRRSACEAEVRINRRTASSLYRGVVPVVRLASGRLALGGEGQPVDWLVDMVRFDQEALFDRLAARGALDLELMPSLGAEVARLHLSAERRPAYGGRRGMTWVVEGNAAGFAEQGEGILDPVQCAALTAAARTAVERHAGLLDRRRADGLVRQCHGDLHLRNSVRLDGRPTLFDAVEFNDEIACVDVLYDAAFLLMDLWRRRLPRHANAVFNGYLAQTADLEGLALLPLFLSCRAAVRAKTSATAARVQPEAPRRRELQELSRDYLRMARALLEAPKPRLIAIGGFSGSGKSTLALGVAPSVGAVPGALVLRSDEIRKALCGVAPTVRLPASAYTSDMSVRVYRALCERAARALRAGHSVVADAVFARRADRGAIERAAADAGAAFTGLWLDAPVEVLIDRAGRRPLDPSDAGAAVIRAQLAAGTDALDWIRIDAARRPEDVLRDVQSRAIAEVRS